MAEYEIERVCPVCGKHFGVLYKNRWAYKKTRAKGGYDFYCSWKCLRVDEMKRKTKQKPVPAKQKKGVNKMSQNKLTREQKGKAVEIAIGGGDPLVYLKECGAKNPAAAWWYIKKTLATKNPQLLEKIPEKIGTVLDENGLAVPAPEKPKGGPKVEIAEKLPPEAVAEVPEEDSGIALIPAEVNFIRKEDFKPKPVLEYKVTEIMTDLGAFKKDSRDGLIYWTTEEGEKVILTHREWNKLAESIPQIIEVLGGAE